MPDLVRSKLPQPRQGGRDRIVGIAGPREPGPNQGLKYQHVLPRPKRTEQHRPLDDLAGSRIVDRLSVGPSARRAVDPVDDIVPSVERVGAFGQNFGAKGIDETRGLECLVPPADTLAKRAPARFGSGAVDVKD